MAALSIALLVFTSLASYALGWIVRGNREDKKVEWGLNRQLLLTESLSLIHRFLNPTSLDSVDYLTPESRKRAENLLEQYKKEVSS